MKLAAIQRILYFLTFFLQSALYQERKASFFRLDMSKCIPEYTFNKKETPTGRKSDFMKP